MESGDKQKVELLEKIDNYLSGDLPEEERLAFEANIKADPSLAEEVAMNRVVNEALKDEKLVSLQEDIDESMALFRKINSTVEVDSEEPEPVEPSKKTVGIFSQKYLAVAASVLLFIITAFGLIQYWQSTSPDALVAAYLEEPYKSPPFFKGSEGVEDWTVNYEQGNYTEAKTALEKIVASDTVSPESEFYLGLCYLYKENPEPRKAARQFENVLDMDSRYNEQALWYIGLAYYQSEQKDLAAETLRKVTGYKQNEAEKLLERMK